MPLIVFVGISSLGALFLMVFIAQICRDDRCQARAPLSGFGNLWGRGRAVRRAPSTIRLVSSAVPSWYKPGGVVVLRRTIQCNGSNRLTPISGKRMQAEERQT